MIEPTSKCSMACTWCPHPSMDREKITSDITFMNDLVKNANENLDIDRLAIVGIGEPFLSPNTPELINYSKSIGLPVAIQTNGAHPKKAKEFQKIAAQAGFDYQLQQLKETGGRIDGTGKDYDKIASQSKDLRQLGYDTHMIFVNTSLDTALQRNAERPRSVPDSIVVKSWNEVQSNIGSFSQHFRENFIVVDNNDAGEDVFVKVFKQIKGLLRKKVQSPLAKQWVMQQMKDRGITRAPKGF